LLGKESLWPGPKIFSSSWGLWKVQGAERGWGPEVQGSTRTPPACQLEQPGHQEPAVSRRPAVPTATPRQVGHTQFKPPSNFWTWRLVHDTAPFHGSCQPATADFSWRAFSSISYFSSQKSSHPPSSMEQLAGLLGCQPTWPMIEYSTPDCHKFHQLGRENWGFECL
jgi:hypothetical protein